MSTVVYQEIQSCLEPRLMEPLVFKHKFTQPKPSPFPQTNDENKSNEYRKKNKSNETSGTWSFLQSLTTPQTNIERIYVHPMDKSSSRTLSKQSLDMCTESLGSETGSFISSSHEFLSISPTKEKDSSVRPSRPRGITKKLSPRSYPPPLTSSFSVQFRPHRENGRLVIRATVETSPNGCFQAERRNGRLKLSLLKEKLYSGSEEEEHGNVTNECVVGVGGNNGKVVGRFENRPNRCKEEGKVKSGISSWGPFLVSTSLIKT